MAMVDLSVQFGYLFLCLQVLTGSVGGVVFCPPTDGLTIEGVTSGSIVTRDDGEAYYTHNMSCQWTIRAPSNTQVITVTVVHSNLAWSPLNYVCEGYDHVRILDGSTVDDSELVSWCWEGNPQHVTSTGPHMTIVFSSNIHNEFPFHGLEGVQLDFSVVDRGPGIGSCGPGWQDNPSLPDGGGSCYALRTHAESWIDALRFCNYDQANIVSINSQEEDNFIADLVSSRVPDNRTVWLSLNDISIGGLYQWLDRTENTIQNRWLQPNLTNTIDNCVTVNTAGQWQLDFCNENNIGTTTVHPFICEKHKVDDQDIFPKPTPYKATAAVPDDTVTTVPAGPVAQSTDSSPGLIAGVSVAVIAAVVVIVVVIVIIILKRRGDMDQRKFGETEQRQRKFGVTFPRPGRP